jgi:hypothetical protein
MKLFLLRPADNLPKKNPWETPYDKSSGFVIRAKTKAEAREIANRNAGGENQESIKNVWLNPKWSTCKELTTEGDAELIMEDYHHG